MKPRILVVDDEKQFAETLAERLRLRMFQVTTAFSGAEALEQIERFNFDLVILDVYLPDQGGLEVLQQIKKLKPLTEVLMLTGHAEVETAIQGMKAGAFDFLLKPAESEELIAKINQAYHRKLSQEERIREAKVSRYVTSPRSALHDD